MEQQRYNELKELVQHTKTNNQNIYKKFSWSAFFFPLIFILYTRNWKLIVPIWLSIFIPFAGLSLYSLYMLYFGFKGNKHLYEMRNCKSTTEFEKIYPLNTTSFRIVIGIVVIAILCILIMNYISMFKYIGIL